MASMIIFLLLWKATSRLPYPPGPKPKLIMGNFHDIPTELPWVTYTEWGRQYGDVVHAQVFGNHVVILNSLKAAVDLLVEKRAPIYSDRPTIPMISLDHLQYRRLFHQHFRRDAIPAYHSVQLRKIHGLLRSLLSTPENFAEHTKTQMNLLTSAIVMATVYGYDIKLKHDQFAEVALPGRFAVNSFPFLRHLPSWFPGCGFHRYAQTRWCRETVCLSELLEQNDTQGSSKQQEQMIKEVAAVTYAGAADTTSVTLDVFIMAMALNPEVVHKAQHEIDTVVGLNCLPGFEHRSTLPYCEAVVREVLRWRPITPLAAMVHNESMYPNPDKFDPGRFLNADGQLNADDHILGLGLFGRQICPGCYAADATVWATIVSILSTFNIAKAKDVTGKEIEIEIEFTDRLVR
ncbi:cytochrome P450 [Mycena olivaceomarginata]|nr:cytochrome P450 [Mycena olivaceomarginata]